MMDTPASAESPSRDEQIVILVGNFRQLTRAHIAALLFSDVLSQTPLDRALKRLVERKYLVRLHRLIGGTKGGSAQYVYQLGRQGWRLLGRAGEYWAPRAVNLHTLAIADCLVKLKIAEKAAALKVASFITEPACHVRVGGLLLTPDAFVELKFGDGREHLISWLEVDRSTEHLSTIKEKCERYWRALMSGQWEGVFPFVLFVVPDEQRAVAVRRLIKARPDDVQQLITVCTQTSFPSFQVGGEHESR